MDEKGFAIRGVNAHGVEFWYTGRAGDGWVSKQPEEAFRGYHTIEGARFKAERLNRYHFALTGIWFTVPVGS